MSGPYKRHYEFGDYTLDAENPALWRDGHLVPIFPKALEMLDRLDKAVDGDPALNLLRAGILIEAGRSRELVPLLQKTIKAMPNDAMAHQVLIGACLEQKKYDLIPASLEQLEKLGEEIVNPEETDDPQWKDFAKSREYRKWKQSQKSS